MPIDITRLAKEIEDLAPKAKEMGISLEEIEAALKAFISIDEEKAIKAAKAGENLRKILKKLVESGHENDNQD